MFSKSTMFCFLFFSAALVFCLAKSFVYVDDGSGQTEVDHPMTRSEKLEMESEILNLLGLSKRPKRVRNPSRMSALRYLMDVYKTMMEEENEASDRVRRETDITSEEYNQIEESDLIMTIESSGDHRRVLRHSYGRELWFNVSEMPLAEDILGAELRVFKNITKAKQYYYSKYTIQAWQIAQTGEGEAMEPVAAANTSAYYSGWIVFNVTTCLRSWVTSLDTEHGIYLSVTPLGKPGKELRLEDVGVVVSKENAETKPFVVSFMRGPVRVTPRRRREAKSKYPKPSFANVMKDSYKYTDADPIDYWRSCKMHHLYISFKDLQWNDWIIAPDGYSAFYCSGKCNFPLHAHMNATNHAIVQTLVHLIHPSRYPKPCCAPTTMRSISVLYFLDDTNVVLKKYRNMMVKSCGCL